jgi:hypothetical protein
MAHVRWAMIGSAVALILATTNRPAIAEVTITITYDQKLDLISPEAIPNIHAQDQFVVVLRDDGSVHEQANFSAGKSQRREVTENALGKTYAGWHVSSRNILTKIMVAPQSTRTITVTVQGTSCHVTVVNRLKPGFSTYKYKRASNGQLGEFTNVSVTDTSCSIR